MSEQKDEKINIERKIDYIKPYVLVNYGKEIATILGNAYNASSATEKLNAVTEEYNKKEQQLRERLVALYEAGSISYLDVLLSSRTLSEFLSRYYKMLEVMEYDNQLINTVEEEDNNIKIYIGKENNLDEDMTVIKTKYKTPIEEGTIAIIGPKRMDYDRVVQLLEFIKENIER